MIDSNWEMCERLAREMDKDKLIRCLLKQVARMRKPRQKSTPLWSFVGDATSHGAGVSTAICNVYGVNSHSGEDREAKEGRG